MSSFYSLHHDTGGIFRKLNENHPSLSELENIKSFTRTNINKPYFTPRKARRWRHFWHFYPTKQSLWGFLWCKIWINYQFMAVCPLILNFLHISSKKWLVFANYFGLPNFLPQLPNFFTRIYPWHFPTLLLEVRFPNCHELVGEPAWPHCWFNEVRDSLLRSLVLWKCRHCLNFPRS